MSFAFSWKLCEEGIFVALVFNFFHVGADLKWFVRQEFDTLWLMVTGGDDVKFSNLFEDPLDIKEEKLTENEKKYTITIDQFVTFWYGDALANFMYWLITYLMDRNKCQSKPLSPEAGRELVLRHVPDKYEFDEGEDITITHNIWVDIFSGPANELFDPDLERVYADMDQPLSHYFIDSSYSTCLTGNQLMGGATIQRYQDALLDGVRCIDAKIWDGEKGEPVVIHGHGITSKLLFVGKRLFPGQVHAAEFFTTSNYHGFRCSEDDCRKWVCHQSLSHYPVPTKPLQPQGAGESGQFAEEHAQEVAGTSS
jgi:hypothetical protein